ncbi:thiol-disulfide oxidoreductase DCC family protein [uncultured Algimonas sp.]|uniref:thiol-disulfide oxidoreductase DCC family protein n=1 Tax=uncultured Algimonas sp. TaxID=1547920 RepID=UPI00260CBEAA|nr:thiol-disulfide oxidoreductase DCC family protein [uncultured Algimonas sp.]
MPDVDDSAPILVFDGHCALCSDWVDFLLKHDRGTFRFLPAQSPLGEALYAHYGFKSSEPGSDYDTNILIENGRARIRSDATLAMFARLPWPWKAVSLLRHLPEPWRDWGYERIARNRIRWFGRRDACRLPTPDERVRFL